MLAAIAFFFADLWVRIDKYEAPASVGVKSWVFQPNDRLPLDFSIQEVFQD